MGGDSVSTTDVTHADDPLVEPDDLEPQVAPAPEDERGWTLRRLLHMLAPALVFLAIREIGLLVLTWMATVNGFSVSFALSNWDGQWFLGIAGNGYDNTPESLRDAFYQHHGETALAFFPGYPALMRLVAGIGTPFGVGLLAAGITITIVSGVITAYGLTRLAGLVRGGSRRMGLILVALFAASPMAIVLSMVYSEALFCALAVWALVGVLERRWLLAGVCCVFAGLVRPTAATLILTVGLAALVAVIKRRDGGWPWLAGALAPVGLVSYLVYVADKTGEVSGWFGVQQRGWATSFDWGRSTWQWAVEKLARSAWLFEIVTVGLIITSLVLAVVCVVRRLEWPLLVYGLGVLVMDLASNGLMSSKVRLMVPAFTLLIPVAIGLAKRRTSTVLVVLGGLIVGSSWLGAYAITTWGYAI
jgi:hypothetical protein